MVLFGTAMAVGGGYHPATGDPPPHYLPRLSLPRRRQLAAATARVAVRSGTPQQRDLPSLLGSGNERTAGANPEPAATAGDRVGVSRGLDGRGPRPLPTAGSRAQSTVSAVPRAGSNYVGPRPAGCIEVRSMAPNRRPLAFDTGYRRVPRSRVVRAADPRRAARMRAMGVRRGRVARSRVAVLAWRLRASVRVDQMGWQRPRTGRLSLRRRRWNAIRRRRPEGELRCAARPLAPPPRACAATAFVSQGAPSADVEPMANTRATVIRF
jgi:hypothetical protein